MHRCSESIGTITAALAKAQAELTNPEKSPRRVRPVCYGQHRWDNDDVGFASVEMISAMLWAKKPLPPGSIMT